MRQTSVDLETLEEVDLSVSGRHDPCILPRIVPVAEAMVAIVLADLMLAGGFIHRRVFCDHRIALRSLFAAPS